MANPPPALPPRLSLSRLTALLGIAGDGLSFWEIMAIAAFAIGSLTIFVFGFAYEKDPFAGEILARIGTLYAVGIGAWMSGGALGFLFGVPRYKSSSETPNLAALSGPARVVVAYTPSTNLEQVSDWLTKIIIGATLVQIGKIVRNLSASASGSAAESISQMLRYSAAASSFSSSSRASYGVISGAASAYSVQWLALRTNSGPARWIKRDLEYTRA